jgi:hypothetical protein
MRRIPEMKLYYTNCSYFATRSEAEKAAREEAKESYGVISVTRVEVATDKANILRMLNDAGGHTVFGDMIYTTKGRLKRED